MSLLDLRVAGVDKTASEPVAGESAGVAPSGSGPAETVGATNPTSRWRRWSRRFGTAGRLAAVHALILGAVLVASGVALLNSTRAGVESIATRQLSSELRSFQQAVSTRPAGQSILDLSTAYLRSHAVAASDLVAIDVAGVGTVANSNGKSLAADPGIVRLLDSAPSRTVITSRTVAGQSTEILVAPIWDAHRLAGVFLATDNLAALQPAASASLRLALGEGLVALVAGVASAYLLLRRLLRRVGRITDAAETISSNQLTERLGEQSTSDEVSALASSFDSMLDRIESAVNAQHELLSDVSHQLRTPLTVVRGHIEILGRIDPGDAQSLRETVKVATDEIDRMNDLIERLLLLGMAREPGHREWVHVDLRAFFGDLSRASQVIADRDWRLGVVPDAVIAFDETEIRGALLNLVDNAVKATTTGGVIAITAELDDARSELRVAVEDSGTGIADEDREAVLDRFARPGGRPAGGTGLGLAIVRAVAEGHGGRVEIDSSPLGGARVIMTIKAERVYDPGHHECTS